ncbi:MAG: beta-ketoacyl-ACP reductase [Halobacteriota archaeon]
MTAERTCIVTGASRGIGAAIARKLGGEGSNVVVNYNSSEAAANDVVADIRDDGGDAIAVQADVSSLEEVTAMATTVHDVYGPADVVVNNAGITVDRPFARMTREEWDRVIDVNLGGAYNCTKVFYEDIQSAADGRLVNISSVVGEQGNYGQANYAATKSALFGFTKTLARELARSGSTANCVAPGFTETDMLDHVSDKIQDRIRSRIPLGRFARVEDIACAVRFVASPEAGYMTGQVISINGGMNC